MNSSFSVTEYVQSLGSELILAYEQARLSNSPGTVGQSRELAIRDKLQKMLSRGIGVGSGFVIDSYGQSSKQMDIVLYEEDLCPVFRLNDSNEAAYYPCEGVFAIGEVKSTIGSKEVEDILEKIGSVRKLTRYAKATNDVFVDDDDEFTVDYRQYGSRTVFSAVPEDSYDQNTRGLNQIWGFGIGRDFALTTETMATKITEYCVKNGRQSAPNLVVATNGMALKPAWADAPEWKGATEIKIVQSAIEATGYIATRHSNPLGALLRSIILTYQKGHTVSLEAFSNYLPAESSRPVLYYSPVPGRDTEEP